MPKCIPCPNWEIWAYTDVVVLGRLITNPKDPESQVFRAGVLIPEKTYEGAKVGWQMVYDSTIGGKIGLWAKCMQIVTGGLTLAHIRSLAAKLEFEFLRTRYFLPDKDYIKNVVQDPGVQAHFKTTHRRKPIYLITGIKIAENPKETLHVGRENELTSELKADATSFGAPVEAGPEGSGTSKRNMTITTKASNDYIFAYSLMRISVKHDRYDEETIKSEPYIKGAAFGLTDAEKAVEYEAEPFNDLGFDEYDEEDTA